MRIKEWLLDNQKRKRCICLIYRNIMKIQPFNKQVVRNEIENNRFSDDITYIWNQFDTLRAYYRLLLVQNTFANKVKLIRIIHKNNMFHIKPQLRGIEKLRKEKQYLNLSNDDKLIIEDLLKYAIKNNNDQNIRRYPTLLNYLNDHNSEKFDQKYTPPLNRTILCENQQYSQAYEYLYDKTQQKQSIKRL